MTTSDADTSPEAARLLAERDEEIRRERRRFFRTIADDAVRTAATLVGAAGALRETTREVADGLLAGADPGLAPGGAGGGAPPPEPGPGFRSPFRLDGDRLLLLDQRRLPGELVEVSCESATDVAQAIREMVIRGAPALGQVAAVGLALAAGQAATARPHARRAILHGAANALRNSRPTAVSPRWASSSTTARPSRRACAQRPRRSSPRPPWTTPGWPAWAPNSSRSRKAGRSDC
jgi:hypothetical protein